MQRQKKQKIEIKPRKDGEPISAVHLFIDGTEIKKIRNLQFEVTPNECPHLILDINAYDISIDAECLMYQKGVGAINFVEVAENPAGE